MKYYRKFNKYQPRSKRKIIYFFPVILFLIVFYLICFSSFFQIKKIEISGNQKISLADLKNQIEENLTKKILFFDSKSLFLVNFKEIQGNILKKYPAIEEVYFSKKLPDRLEVSIKERSPVAVFEKDNNYFFIDESGIVFEKVQERQNFLLIKKPDFTQEINLGQNIIKKEEISQFLKVGPEFKNRNLEFQADLAELVNEQRFNVKTSEGFDVYFDLLGDISQQVLNLSVILKEKISPEVRRNLEYIDLRFGNQIYYK